MMIKYFVFVKLIKVSVDQSEWSLYLDSLSSFHVISSDTVELVVIHRNNVV